MHVSQLINLSENDVWLLEKGLHTVEDDDGNSITVTSRRLILTWYFWELFRQFPYIKPSVKYIIPNKPVTSGFELKFAALIFFDIADAIIAKGHEERFTIWPMAKLTYEIMNNIHNMTALKLQAYASSTNLEDIYTLITIPEIAQARKAMAETKDFESGYNVIMEAAAKPVSALRHNGIAKMIRASLLSNKQLVQFLGARGHVYNTDNTIFPEPITAAYVDGLHNIYDSFTESRSASRSYYMNDKPLKDSEYLNRRIQLLTEIISEVDTVDCGTPHTVEWVVNELDKEALYGKFFIEDGKPVMFDNDAYEKYLGKAIQVRSITQCQHKDTNKVCYTCLGYVSYFMPPHTNIGHFLSTTPLAMLSQLILSTKHVETSAGAKALPLTGDNGKWLRIDEMEPTRIHLSNPDKPKRIKVTFLEEHALALNAYLSMKRPMEVDPKRITDIHHLKIVKVDENNKEISKPAVLDVSIEKSGSCLSKEALLEMHKGNIVKRDGTHVEFILEDFHDKPFIITPRCSDNIILYQEAIKNYIFVVRSPSIVNNATPGEAIAELKALFDTRIKLHFTNIEVFVKACMTVNGTYGDYRLPRGGDDFVFMPAGKILENRSVSAAAAYERQRNVLLNADTYTSHNRPRHALDQVLVARADKFESKGIF